MICFPQYFSLMPFPLLMIPNATNLSYNYWILSNYSKTLTLYQIGQHTGTFFLTLANLFIYALYNSKFPTSYSINGYPITTSNTHRGLGIILSTDLSWKDHRSYISTKATKPSVCLDVLLVILQTPRQKVPLLSPTTCFLF